MGMYRHYHFKVKEDSKSDSLLDRLDTTISDLQKKATIIPLVCKDEKETDCFVIDRDWEKK